jgi:RNA polymerase sigma factor (sigma-70 family)
MPETPPLTEQTDAELVGLVSENNPDAFDVIAMRYLGAMYAVALARLCEREAAEDLVQEVLIQAYLNLDTLEAPEKVGPWLTSIARNTALNWLKAGRRRSKVLPLVPLDDVHDSLADPEQKGARVQMQEKETRSWLEKAIKSLEPDERELVLLYYTEELSKSEIARQTGLHPSTVGRRLDKAFARMRSDLEPVLREEGRKLRPSNKFQTRTLLVISAAAALSAETKSAIAASSGTVAVTQASAALATLGTGAAFAADTITKGSILMTMKVKIAALVAAIGLLGGGITYMTQEGGGRDNKKIEATVAQTEGQRPSTVQPNDISTPADRPVDFVVAKHRESFERYLEPAKTPSQPYKDGLRSLEPTVFTSTTLEFRMNWEEPPHVRAGDIKYTIVKQDTDKTPEGTPYLKPVALGIGRTDEYTSELIEQIKSGQYRSVQKQFYNMSGEIIPWEETGLPGNRRTYANASLSGTNSALQIIYDVYNLDRPRLVGSLIFDANTFAHLSFPSSWKPRENNPHEVLHVLKVQHPVEMIWVVDVAHGPVETIDIPLKKDAEADFGDVLVRVMTDPFVAYSNSNMVVDNRYVYDFVDNERWKRSNFVVGMTPKCFGHLMTFEYLDAEGQPISSESSLNGTLKLLNNFQTGRDIAELRVNRYAGVKRFVVPLGKLPGTPPENDGVRDLMDVRIPYVYEKRFFEIWKAVEGATELGVNMHPIDSSTAPVQSEYFDVTPRELLETNMPLAPPGYELDIDTKDGMIKLKKIE